MDQASLLELVLLRHGDTQYTGEFPDLTEKGLLRVKEVARGAISEWLSSLNADAGNLSIISSPSIRAHGTAHVVKKTLHCPHPVLIHRSLDAMKWRDAKRCGHALGGLKGKGYIDYETEPVFKNATLFETPSEMRNRWYRTLSSFIAAARDGQMSRLNVVVSHYEMFCHVVHDLFGITASKETALQYAEPIFLSIITQKEADTVLISGAFRGVRSQLLFDHHTQKFLRS